MKCLGGNRRGLREIYIIEASAAFLLTSDGGVIITQFDFAFAETAVKLLSHNWPIEGRALF